MVGAGGHLPWGALISLDSKLSLSSVCIPWACSPLGQPRASPGHTGCRAGKVTLSREARMDKQDPRACGLLGGNDSNRSHAQDEDKTCIFHTLHKNELTVPRTSRGSICVSESGRYEQAAWPQG